MTGTRSRTRRHQLPSVTWPARSGHSGEREHILGRGPQRNALGPGADGANVDAVLEHRAALLVAADPCLHDLDPRVGNVHPQLGGLALRA